MGLRVRELWDQHKFMRRLLMLLHDINDNPMKSAHKTVHLWSTEVNFSL